MYCDADAMHDLRNKVIRLQKYAYDIKNGKLIELIEPIIYTLHEALSAEEPKKKQP